jgi:putative SOS response-associated peptidase YedK
MCGRFALIASQQEIEAFASISFNVEMPPRYNIAPTQPITVVTNFAGTRQPLLVRWGLIPGWVKDPDDFPLIINARSETAAEKASFRAAMRHRRAIIPATGFYEWRRPPGGKGKSQAFHVRPKGGGLVGLAALWESWMGADGTEIDTGAILTTSANETFQPIHDRLPVAISPEKFDFWLDTVNQEPRDVQPLLVAPDEDFWEAIPVGDAVNKVANRGPEIQTRVEDRPVEAQEPKKQMDLF